MRTEIWNSSTVKKAGRLVIGLIALAGLVAVFASGITPPGCAGEVYRHNKTLRIDASPIFYTEVEGICEMISRAEEWHRAMVRSGETIIDSEKNTIDVNETY